MVRISKAWNWIIMRFCTDEKFDREYGEKSEPYPTTIRLFYWEIAMILLIGLLVALPGSLNKYSLWPIVFFTVWLDVLRTLRRKTPMWKQSSLWQHVHPIAILMMLTVGNLIYGIISFLISWGLTYLDQNFLNGTI